MLLYASNITPRISYTFRVIFERILNCPIKFTANIDAFLATKGPKMAYSPQQIETSVWMEATPLLFEDNIVKQNIVPEKWEDIMLFYPTKNGNFPVDFVAIIFFLISRYEEYYEDNMLDKHDRFQCQNSVAHKLGWHRKLIVHRLAIAIAEILVAYYPQFEYKTPQYEELSTHDVDIAYQYKGKPWWRWCGAITKALLRLRFEHANNYLKATLGKEIADPFDNFEPENAPSKPIYFILTSNFTKYDKNISPKNKAFRDLIRRLVEFSEIGLHPSYYSSNKTSLIEKEKKCLEEVSQLKITKSRQHFLRFRFPDTFRALIKAGITDDYSLGWHDEAGFRASIAVPYPFFDLVKNEETTLMLHPLALMDGIFSREEDEVILDELREEVEKMGGDLIVLTHNSNIKY
ncbi:MAG: polysaccharide deacetylase family protein [Bacteroidetes bacterium]|nr:polysaccharide deacetylase family protein [Bacteroidota bacterium]MCL2302111.1 polysaccharide deacetylase family protein [Lentimicrobiaceae bacterium]